MTGQSRKRITYAAIASVLCIAAASVEGRVLSITVDSTTTVAGGPFGDVGAYELVRGRAFGELDPSDRRNAVITDIMLAHDADGKVRYTAQFAIHKPVDMNKASGIMVYNVPNRGGISVPYSGGDSSFLFRRGDIVLNSAWQGDIRIVSLTTGSLGINVPVARYADGSAVVGPVVDRFVAVNPTATAWQTTVLLTGPGRDLADVPNARLISATSETPSGVKSGVQTIPATDFAFADCTNVPFPGRPDPQRLCIRGGFNPALLYELARDAKNPFVLGVGNAAMRDVISYFRRDRSAANPIGDAVKTVIGFGNSQSGRFQKHMINNGFNEDENGRMVWDGMNPNIAGMMGSFNIRFAQPGDIAEMYFPGADGPLWWADYRDTVRGRPAWGLLTRCTQTRTCPKIMETYGGPEIWYSRGSVGIAGTRGTEDLKLPKNVRRYYHAGTTHGGGSGGYTVGTPGAPGTLNATNPNPQSYINRALYVAMVEWVTEGRKPPKSVYPNVKDRTLVKPTSAAMGWPAIPNAPTPDGVMNPVLDYDFGPLFRYNDDSGIISNSPPPIKRVIPTLGGAVDKDGNEIAGLKSILARLPLGTYTGWRPIVSGPLAGREASLAAGYIPFPKTKADRLATGDPRKERYTSLWMYYTHAVSEARDMIRAGLLLPDDATREMERLLTDMRASNLLPQQGMPALVPTPDWNRGRDRDDDDHDGDEDDDD
jgi:hypothetical protein